MLCTFVNEVMALLCIPAVKCTPCSTCLEMLPLYFFPLLIPAFHSVEMGLVCFPSVSFMHMTLSWEKLRGEGGG